MTAEDVQDIPLAELLQRALDRHEAAEASSAASDQEATGWLLECEQRVDALGLFSANEELEDVSTASLKFLLPPFLLAELHARTGERDPAARSNALSAAMRSYNRFLERCDAYGLVPPEARADAPADPQSLRERKIARFRREKAARQRLQQQQASLASLRISSKSEADADADAEEAEGSREAWLARIELAVLQAVEQLPLLQQELQLLRHAQARPRGEESPPQPQPPADVLQKLREAAAALQGQSRAALQAEVFRPSHALPTRSLEQQARIELAAAAAAEAKQRKAAEERRRLESDEDWQLAKQRAWDDWKDDNPRGAGNSKLRPTA